MDEKNTRLRYWRNLKVMTVRELAKKAGINPMTISNIENRGATPTKTVAQKLATALGIEPKDLYKEEIDWQTFGKRSSSDSDLGSRTKE